MRLACAGRRRERRLVLVAEIVEVSSREQEKTLFALKYRFLEWQKVTLADFVVKKQSKTAKTGPYGPVFGLNS